MKQTVLTEGTITPVFTENSTAYIQYKAFLGNEFLSQTDKEFPVRVKKAFVIPELSSAILTMKIGEVSRFYIDLKGFHLMEKSQGRHSGCCGSQRMCNIPDSIEIELVRVVDEVMSWELSENERLEKVKELKSLGNEKFQNNQIEEALVTYSKALEFAVDQKDLEEPIKLNIVACLLEQKNYSNAKLMCEAILEKNPTSLKANYRLLKSLIGLELEIEACNQLKKCNILKIPVSTQVAEIELLQKSAKSRMANISKNMFK